MTEWAPKRFYESANVVADGDGFAVRLDDRPIRTPGKRFLVVPTDTMAEAVAAEWDAQDGAIDPRTMPWTRSVNSAIDKVAAQKSDVMDHLIDYAETDLLYYRAKGPEALTELQSRTWDPILDWAGTRYDVRFRVASGVMPVAQDKNVVITLRDVMNPMSEFHLTGFHDLVTLSGSFVLALAAVERLQASEAVWDASRLDEDWQAEQWGVDDEAAEAAVLRKSAFLHALAFFRAA